ncbi:(2Fe-2S) ferredoxin domain-containing protein [Streptomyces sp. NPDC017940]|uniref:(2Fe-2S) ferredoxin domain-containing protein n=1 Tax=Streptomyces sp. NPDC017940 TaxID=3365017 RepID=UPI00379A4E44
MTASEFRAEPAPAPPAAVAVPRPAARPCTLVVCRGCCCGDPGKHPGTDHAGQLARLRAAAERSGGRFTVRTSDCLGPCGQANIVVLQPSRDGRARGGRPAWVGFALDDASLDDILAWAEAGGPGLADPPDALTLQLVDPRQQ